MRNKRLRSGEKVMLGFKESNIGERTTFFILRGYSWFYVTLGSMAPGTVSLSLFLPLSLTLSYSLSHSLCF